LDKNFAILEEKNKKNLPAGALARVHVLQEKTLVVENAFIIEKKEIANDNQLQLFPLVLVYLLRSNAIQYIYESQVLEILSIPA
jgi:hypothetical protein